MRRVAQQVASRCVASQGSLAQARAHCADHAYAAAAPWCAGEQGACVRGSTSCRVVLAVTSSHVRVLSVCLTRSPCQAGPCGRSIHVTSVARGGAGTPVTQAAPVTSEVAEQAELTWDDGTLHPEPCLDDPAPQLTAAQGAGYLGAGLSVFGLFYLAARVNNKAARVPYAPRVYPYDGLKAELGKA